MGELCDVSGSQGGGSKKKARKEGKKRKERKEGRKKKGKEERKKKRKENRRKTRSKALRWKSQVTAPKLSQYGFMGINNMENSHVEPESAHFVG